MSIAFTVALLTGGALGAWLRYAVTAWLQVRLPGSFPAGTFAVNAVGSFILGLVFVPFVERFPVRAELRAFVMIGFLGSFTTFSTFSLDTLLLLRTEGLVAATRYVLASVVAGVLAAWTGMAMAAWLLDRRLVAAFVGAVLPLTTRMRLDRAGRSGKGGGTPR